MRTHNKHQNKHQKTQKTRSNSNQIPVSFLIFRRRFLYSRAIFYSSCVFQVRECLVGKKSPVYQYSSWYEPPAWDGTSLYIPCWILIKTYYHPLMNKSVVSRNKLSFLWIVWIDFLQSELQALHSQPSIFFDLQRKTVSWHLHVSNAFGCFTF